MPLAQVLLERSAVKRASPHKCSMKSHWFMLLLLSLVLAVRSSDTTRKFEYNPCDFKTCSKNEVCRVVIQHRLLQMPVAVCTPPDDKNLTSNNNRGSKDCLTVKSGTNILNCKTEEEWRRGGDAACSERGLTLRSTKVKHICHNTSLRRYLQAAYVCCSLRTQEEGHGSKEITGTTPPVITSTPAAPTSPSQEEQDKKGANKTPTVAVQVTSSTASPTVMETSVSLSGEDATDASYILLAVIVLGFAFLVLILSYLIYKRRKKSKNTAAARKPADTTVIINPHCEGAVNYVDLSNFAGDTTPLHEAPSD